MINRFPSRVLDFKTAIELLARFYPHLRTSNGSFHLKYLGVLPLFMCLVIIEGNMILVQLSVSSSVIHQPKRDINATILS